MSVFTRVNFLIIILLSLSACGGGGGGAPANTADYRLLPADYFSGAYSDTYVLAGSDNTGDNYTATWNVSSGADTTFNSKPVKTIYESLTLTNTDTNGTGIGGGDTYFTTDINNLTVEGSLSISGIESIADTTTVIPVTARIGDSGNIGSYTKSDGTTETGTWALEDASNGLAYLIISDIERDAIGTLDSTEVHKWLISEDGTRLNVDVILTYHQTGLVITMIGQ